MRLKNPGRPGRRDQNQQNERAGEGGERGRTGGGPGNANDPFLLPSPSVLALEGQQQGISHGDLEAERQQQ